MKAHQPPFYAMYVFTVVARHQNLTHAADELYMTQGAVSRQIANLENYLGNKLFARHARGLTLTEEGLKLLPDYQQAFATLARANRSLSQGHEVIHLKAPTCALRWLLPRLKQIEKEMGCQISLHTSQQHDVNFKQENIDLAMTYHHHPPQTAIRLFDEYLQPVMAPGEQSLPADPKQWDLNQLTLLHPSNDGSDWQQWLTHVGVHQRPIKSQFFATMDLAINAAMQGFGITVADREIISAELKNGRLIAASEQTIATGAGYYLQQHPEQQGSWQPIIDALCQSIGSDTTPSS